MQSLISGVVLAALSGLTALAFKHPHAYSKLSPYLISLVSAAFYTLTVWHAGVRITWTMLRPYVETVQHDAARAAVGALQLPYVWVCIAYAAALLYLMANLFLPRFIRATEQPDPRGTGSHQPTSHEGTGPNHAVRKSISARTRDGSERLGK